MIKVKVFSLITFLCLIFLSVNTTIYAQYPLSDLLSHPNCSDSCWLEIVPSLTTDIELEAILNTEGIQFDKNSIGMEGSGFSYRVIGGYNDPIVVTNSIVIFVTEGIVQGISIRLDNVSVENVITAYGSPNRIVDDVGQSIAMAYVNQGLAFIIRENEPNNVYNVFIETEDRIISSYINSNFLQEEFEPCTNNNQLCAVNTATPTSITTVVPTPTSPPISGDFTVTSRIDGQDDTQQSIFAYTLTNTSSTPQSNLYMRLFFTVDNGRTADDYLLQNYYDSSNALTISGPFQWDATNHYFILSYSSSTLAPNASYQFQGVLRLSDWSNNHSASNDWWHTGILNFQDSQTDYLPVYANGVLNTGSVPNGAAQPTNTPAPTTVPVSTSTPNGTALLQVESRIDGNDDTQQAGFRYRLSNTSTQAQGNLSTRIYFTLDGSQVASDYVLEKYFDQSGVATISGPILANGNTYYFQVSYGATSLQPNSAWEFQGALHLVNYASNFSSSNDWWHTDIGSAYQVTTYIPSYINAVIEVGQEP